MRFSWVAAAALMLLCGSAQAEQQKRMQPADPAAGKLTIGIGLICNTSRQMERYVSLRADGTEMQHALLVVNREARDPRACGLAAVAYLRDRTVETKDMEGKVVAIVRVNIVAGYDGRQWSAVAPMIQYAMMETDGYAI